MPSTMLSLVLMWLADQPGVIAPIDIRSNRLEEATGTSWRVFAVATDRRIGPVGNNCVAFACEGARPYLNQARPVSGRWSEP